MNTFSPIALCGRADLIRARAAGRLAEAAALLDYERRPRRSEPRPVTADPAPALQASPPEPLPADAPLAPITFWRPVSYVAVESLDPDASAAETEMLGDLVADAEDGELPDAPAFQPLGAFAALLPGLRRAATQDRPAAAPDIPRMVRRLGRGEAPTAMPRVARRRWGERLCVITDASPHLTPYRTDYRALLADLARLAPRGAVETRPWPAAARLVPPSAGAVVIALSDLGTLAGPAGRARDAWADFGRDLARAGCRPVAVLPAALGAGLSDLSRVWILTGWERPAGPCDPVRDREADLTALRALAAPAIRIEPGLLRGLRRLIGGDAGLEAAFWRSDYIAEPHDVAATPDPQARKDTLAAFAALPRQTRAQVLALLKRWHAEDLPWVWRMEIAALDPDSQALLATGELDALANEFAAYADRMLANPPLGALSWGVRLAGSLPGEAWAAGTGADPERPWRQTLRRALVRTWAAAHAGAVAAPPPGYDPALLPRSDNPRRRYAIRQHGGDLVVTLEGTLDAAIGVPLATIEARREEFAIEPGSDFWASGPPPSWADVWGCDGYGPWVEFSVPDDRGESVVQRMRWIPAGRFWMGSPEDEPGRLDREGPRHEVTISRGFWLFDTACPQRLWRAVMGWNPSVFRGDDRPVERVSWDYCLRFIDRLNALVPGLNLVLPSEAQWEYACRAGTRESYSLSVEHAITQFNHMQNYSYYRTQSGPKYRSETIDVASAFSPPNAFGLRQMHGNVWEWCADGMREYSSMPVVDPVGPIDPEGPHVLRGGSWNDGPDAARSAMRLASHPDQQHPDTGFRPARVQAGAEPEGMRRIREAERRIAASPAVGAGDGAEILIPGGPKGRRNFSAIPALVIRSDCEHFSISPVTRPPWASAMGRDRNGLWTRFEIERPGGAPVAQRLRWISPGSFMMGSPEDEEGRHSDEGSPRPVTFVRGFWLFDTACTQALWTVVMGDNPSRFAVDSRNPVEQVTWNDCTNFIDRINALKLGLDLFLPSEAQWEYACRAGTTTPFSFGFNVTPDQVNYGGRRREPSGKRHADEARTVPVGSLPPNPWGLHEMHGNVWEWCADHFHPTYDGAPRDGSAWVEINPNGGSSRVLRGGSWGSSAGECRSAYRRDDEPDGGSSAIGFRCARVQT